MTALVVFILGLFLGACGGVIIARWPTPVIDADHVAIHVLRDELFAHAVSLVHAAERRYPNGQARWHWVYGQLLEAWPQRKAEIGRVIEAARQEIG